MILSREPSSRFPLGHPAVTTPLQGGSGVFVYYGRGEGTFYLQSVLYGTMTFAGAANVAGLAVADFNDEGLADIVTPLENGSHVLVYLSNGRGQFETSYFASGVSCAALATADFNKKGRSDIAIVAPQPDVPPNTAVIVLSKVS